MGETGGGKRPRRRKVKHFTAERRAVYLEHWRRTGQKKDGGESVGYAAGRRIVALLRMDETELDETDCRLMRKTIGFIARHRAQEPENIVSSRWRHALMNWGNDPLKSL